MFVWFEVAADENLLVSHFFALRVDLIIQFSYYHFDGRGDVAAISATIQEPLLYLIYCDADRRWIISLKGEFCHTPLV